MVLFDKFLNQLSFDFNDFSVNLREAILGFDQNTDETQLAIQLLLTIEYESNDDLCNISEFIVDLDPGRKDVHLLFECSINKNRLLEGIQTAGTLSKEKFIQKYPNWQLFADTFVLRRSIINITGYQKCYTGNFDASELESHLDPGFVDLKSFAVPGLDRGSIPKGKYQLKELSFKDLGDGFTIVTVHYIQKGEWELVELFTFHPDPVTGETNE